MTALWVAAVALLWGVVLVLGFLLLGALRSIAVLRWRLDELEATTPNRVGRSGLKPGTPAPDFTLPSAAGPDVSLREFAGRRVLLVFTQTGCGPCQAVLPELNRVQADGELQVVVVNHGEPEPTREWAAAADARFPVLVQETYQVSRSFQVYATPFAFLIDEAGVVRAKGIANSRQQIGFVLDGAGHVDGHAEPEHAGTGVEVS
jgi:methylamine dehydrogenase accessory protein MauD